MPVTALTLFLPLQLQALRLSSKVLRLSSLLSSLLFLPGPCPISNTEFAGASRPAIIFVLPTGSNHTPHVHVQDLPPSNWDFHLIVKSNQSQEVDKTFTHTLYSMQQNYQNQEEARFQPTQCECDGRDFI